MAWRRWVWPLAGENNSSLESKFSLEELQIGTCVTNSVSLEEAPRGIWSPVPTRRAALAGAQRMWLPTPPPSGTPVLPSCYRWAVLLLTRGQAPQGQVSIPMLLWVTLSLLYLAPCSWLPMRLEEASEGCLCLARSLEIPGGFTAPRGLGRPASSCPGGLLPGGQASAAGDVHALLS